MDSFKDAPISITEVRSTREGSGSAWLPRDVLIYCLREIDKNELKPKKLIVVWEDEDSVGFSQSSDGLTTLLGMLQRAMMTMWHD